MPRNSTTGVFTRVANSFSNPVYGTVIDPTNADALFDDYDGGLNDFLNVDESDAVVTGTGTITARNLGDRAADYYNVKDFGAVADSTGTGLGTDNRAAFQACIDAAITNRKKVLIPGGAYRIGSPGLTIDVSANTGSTEPRLSVQGGGRGTTLLYFDVGDYTGLYWKGGATGSGVHAISTISNFYLRKTDILGSAIKIEDAAFMSVNDIYCSGWDTGVELVDCLSMGLSGIISRFNNYGVTATRLNGSQPNAISLYSCVLGNNQENAAVLTRPGNFNMFGGSIESNGALGVTGTKGGIYITEGPSQAGCSLGLYGVYIENNTGTADVLVSNSSGFQGTYHFSGCSFQRISSTNYTTNNVRLTGTTSMVVSFSGCSFKRLGTYVADPSRPYLDISGASSASADMDISNYQMDASETYTQPPVPITSGGTGATTASGARTNLGLGTIATQNSNSVAITGGSITGITDLAIADGGTGASTDRGACSNISTQFIISSFAGWSTQSTSETALRTVTIPAGAMGPAGFVRVTSLWEGVGTADTKTPRIRFGGTSGTQYMAIALAATNLSLKDDRIVGNTSESSQVGGISSAGNGGGWGSSTAASTSSSVDTTSAVDLVFSGQVANPADLLRLRGYIIEVFYGA